MYYNNKGNLIRLLISVPFQIDRLLNGREKMKIDIILVVRRNCIFRHVIVTDSNNDCS